jgi:SH3-like domain-containing protein
MAEAMLRQATLSRAPAPLRVSAGEVRMRKGPSTDYAVIETLARSTRVLAESEAGDWVRVRAPSGNTGWVHGSLLDGR